MDECLSENEDEAESMDLLKNKAVVVQSLIERVVLKDRNKDVFWSESHFGDQMLVVRFRRPIAYINGYPLALFYDELLTQYQYGNIEIFRDRFGQFNRLQEVHEILKMGCNDALFLKKLEHLLAYDRCLELLDLCVSKNIFLISLEERLFLSSVRMPMVAKHVRALLNEG